MGKHHGDNRAYPDPPGLEVNQVRTLDAILCHQLTTSRIALDKTVGVVREKLPQVARATEAQAEPAYARVTRQPLSRLAQIKQSQSRWHSTKQTINNSVRYFSTSRAGARTHPTSRTASAVARQTARAPFASQLRPNLTGGTLSRTAGSYGLGGGRVGGARYFSHSPAAPAQVVNNVSQAVRAFWLSGSKAQFDGFNPRTGNKRYRAVSEVQEEARQKMDMSSAAAKGSFIDFKVSPTITAVGPLASVPRSSTAYECEEDASLNNTATMSNLAVDFARALKDLAAVMNDLKHLSTLGDLPISLENSTTLRVRFPGCDRDTVENLCRELNIRRGIVGQDEGFDQKTGTEMALLFPFAPSRAASEAMYETEIRARPPKRAKREHVNWHEMISPTVTNSPGHSHRSATSSELEFEEIVENPWLSSPSGYSSLHASEMGNDNVAVYFPPDHKTAQIPQQTTGHAGVEDIYRFIEECDRARR